MSDSTNRYFVLEGDLHAKYDELEKTEFEQIGVQMTELLGRGVKSWRVGRNGGICSLLFEDGKIPENVSFVSPGKQYPRGEVKPHGKARDAKEWRDFLGGIRVTVSASKEMSSVLGIKSCLTALGGSLVLAHGRVARVGPEVIAEVPVVEEKEFLPKEGMREIKLWEFEKMKEDYKDYAYDRKVYVLK